MGVDPARSGWVVQMVPAGGTKKHSSTKVGEEEDQTCLEAEATGMSKTRQERQEKGSASGDKGDGSLPVPVPVPPTCHPRATPHPHKPYGVPECHLSLD